MDGKWILEWIKINRIKSCVVAVLLGALFPITLAKCSFVVVGIAILWIVIRRTKYKNSPSRPVMVQPLIWPIMLAMITAWCVVEYNAAQWPIAQGYYTGMATGARTKEAREKLVPAQVAAPRAYEASRFSEAVREGMQQAMFGLVALVVLSIVLWFMFWNPTGKDRTDLLSTNDAKEKAKALARGTAEAGVLAGVLAGVSAPLGASPPNNLYATIEDRACVIGPPGTGKTSFLVAQILTWAATGRPFVAIDTKPELWGITRKRLEAAGYTVLCFNPTEGCGDRYDPIQDCHTPEAIGELAAALIPASMESDTGVFSESARDFLDAIIHHRRALGRDNSLPAIFDYFIERKDAADVVRDLVASPDPYVQRIAGMLSKMSGGDRLLASIFGTLSANLRVFRYPAVAEAMRTSDFSLSDLLTKRVALFLQFEESKKELTGRLQATIIGHIFRYLIDHTTRSPVFLALDEIGNAAVVPALPAKLNTIRSRNLPTWMYWQSIEQMQRYGVKADEGANLILGACDWQVVFRLNDTATAEWMSQRIGVVDRKVTTSSVSTGKHGSSSTNTGLVTEPKLWPHELAQLKDGEIVVNLRGHAFKATAPAHYAIWPEFQGVRPGEKEIRPASWLA